MSELTEAADRLEAWAISEQGWDDVSFHKVLAAARQLDFINFSVRQIKAETLRDAADDLAASGQYRGLYFGIMRLRKTADQIEASA